MPQADLLTLAQVARMMNVVPEVALEIAAVRRLPFLRDTRDGVFIEPSDLSCWLAAARHAGGRPDGDI
jgi:hypothetical protein